MAERLPDFAPYAEYVRLIDVPAVAQGRLLDVIMDGESGQAMGYLRHDPSGGEW
jgi:hypothetical protein